MADCGADIRLPSGPKFVLTLSIIVAILFLFFSGQTSQFGLQPRMLTRFCYNSPNLSTINSQCVLCNYYLFDATLLGCTGSTALNVNISATQAFCVITQCLGQIRQAPVFLGRRKRELDATEEDEHNGITLPVTYKEEAANIGNWSEFTVAKQVEVDVYYNREED